MRGRDRNLEVLPILAMLAALIGYSSPVAFFDEDEAIANLVGERTPGLPRRGWVGPLLAVGFGLVALVSFDVWRHETLRSTPPGSGLAVFLAAGLIGVGAGGAISGYCSYGSGSRWQSGRVHTFYDPGRARKVAAVRAGLGVVVLMLVVLEL